MEPIVNQQANAQGTADPSAQNLQGGVSPADQAYLEQVQPTGAPLQQQETLPSEQQTGNYITRQDLDAILSQRESDIIRRASQSATDRVSARVNERLSAIEMNKSALGLSEEQLQQAKQRIIQEEMTNSPEAQPGQSVSPDSPNPQEQEILGMMEDVFKNEGIEVLASDPEGKIIQDAINSPNTSAYKVRKAIMEATAKKTARMQQRSTGMQTPPGSGPAAKNFNNMSTTQLWDTAYKK